MQDRSFTFILKTPPASFLIRKAAGIPKGSGAPNTQKVGSLTTAQLKVRSDHVDAFGLIDAFGGQSAIKYARPAVWEGMLSLCSAGDCRAEDAGSELHELGSGHAHCGRHSKEHGREDRDSSGINLQRVAVKGHQIRGFSILAWPSCGRRAAIKAVSRPDRSHASRNTGFLACCDVLSWGQRVSQPDTLATLIWCCKEQGSPAFWSVPPACTLATATSSKSDCVRSVSQCVIGSNLKAGRPDNATSSCQSQSSHSDAYACLKSMLTQREHESPTAAFSRQLSQDKQIAVVTHDTAPMVLSVRHRGRNRNGDA